MSRQRTALSVACRSSRGQISGSVCIDFIAIRDGTPNDSVRSVGLGIKRNGGLPMCHSESGRVLPTLICHTDLRCPTRRALLDLLRGGQCIELQHRQCDATDLLPSQAWCSGHP